MGDSWPSAASAASSRAWQRACSSGPPCPSGAQMTLTRREVRARRVIAASLVRNIRVSGWLGWVERAVAAARSGTRRQARVTRGQPIIALNPKVSAASAPSCTCRLPAGPRDARTETLPPSGRAATAAAPMLLPDVRPCTDTTVSRLARAAAAWADACCLEDPTTTSNDWSLGRGGKSHTGRRRRRSGKE